MKAFHRVGAVVAPALLILGLVAAPAGAVTAPAVEANFEPPTYTVGTVHLQDGWQSLGGAGLSACPTPAFTPYDHAVVANTFGYPTFGAQSLRISNAVVSGCFHDGTFSKETVDEAGETTAVNGGHHEGGTRQNHFEGAWDFASTVPGAEQPGLVVNVSPDRGDGHRMSRVRMMDTPTGLEVAFYGVQGESSPVAFLPAQTIASGLDRSVPHRIKITMDFVEGPSNDVVRVFVDGALRHTGGSWENYYRFDFGAPALTRTVDSLLFRTGPTAAPALAGKGFVFDNITASTAPLSLPAVVGQSVNWLQGTELITGGPTNPFTFAPALRPLVPVVGDWDGNGTKTPGIFKGGSFYLSNTVGPEVQQVIPFGDARGYPVVGDFDGDRTDDLAVYRNGFWQLRLSTGATTGFSYGAGTWPNTVPVAGDWDGNGIDGIGTYTYATGTWQVLQTASSVAPAIGPFVFWQGAGSYPVVGDWDGDGIDGIGVRHGTRWHLSNSTSSDEGDVPRFDFGLVNDLPLTWY